MAVDLRLRILDADAAGTELERGALQLGDELRDLEVDDVRPLDDGAAPDGTRGGTAAALGALLVSLNPTAGVLSAVVGTVRAWLKRPGAARSVHIEVGGDVLELTGTTSEVQERLVEEWIRAHAHAEAGGAG
ncbi:MAG: hypothetical protein QOD68_2454 [Actinomycetota bacterium]|jgi:hypothetical protein|nr:hypothetical protein [Actinomycetota bacterium]